MGLVSAPVWTGTRIRGWPAVFAAWGLALEKRPVIRAFSGGWFGLVAHFIYYPFYSFYADSWQPSSVIVSFNWRRSHLPPVSFVGYSIRRPFHLPPVLSVACLICGFSRPAAYPVSVSLFRQSLFQPPSIALISGVFASGVSILQGVRLTPRTASYMTIVVI